MTLLVKVKTHRGDQLNEEADIRAEMGCRKEQKEVIWVHPLLRRLCSQMLDPPHSLHWLLMRLLKFGKVPGSNSFVEKKFKLGTRKYEEYKGVRFGNGDLPRG